MITQKERRDVYFYINSLVNLIWREMLRFSRGSDCCRASISQPAAFLVAAKKISFLFSGDQWRAVRFLAKARDDAAFSSVACIVGNLALSNWHLDRVCSVNAAEKRGIVKLFMRNRAILR